MGRDLQRMAFVRRILGPASVAWIDKAGRVRVLIDAPIWRQLGED